MSAIPFDKLESFPLACTLYEIEFEAATDKLYTPENIGGWIESARSDRQGSKYFGPISNQELSSILFRRGVNAEQREQAAIVLRSRFVDEHIDEICRIATAN